jgi:beta-fructofuranosidase
VDVACLATNQAPTLNSPDPAGSWAVPADSLTGPFHIDDAYPLTDDDRYVGRFPGRDDGQWLFFAFRNLDPDGNFLGGITDPAPVHWINGRLTLATPPERHPHS